MKLETMPDVNAVPVPTTAADPLATARVPVRIEDRGTMRKSWIRSAKDAPLRCSPAFRPGVRVD